MLPQRIEDIDEALISQLCADKCPESQMLDFKRELPARDEDGRAEVSKDVCAFANASGGDLVYGVSDAGGCASAPNPVTGETSDGARRRLLQVLEARLEPRVLGLQAYPVPAIGGGYFLVLRVPASFNGPHRYRHGDAWRFVVRSGTHTADLTYPELRTAFDRTATLSERARQFRAERLAMVQSGTAPRPLVPGPQSVVHIVPLAAITGRKSIDVERLYHDGHHRFRYSDWHSYNRALNLEGLLIHHVPTEEGNTPSFVQIFRTGAFEAVRRASDLGGEHVMWASAVCTHIRESLEKFSTAAPDLSIVGPMIIGVSLLRIGGYPFAIPSSYGGAARSSSDRQDLILPETWIERAEEIGPVDAVARPVFDLLYQCFGVPKCNLYDTDGRWIGDRY